MGEVFCGGLSLEEYRRHRAEVASVVRGREAANESRARHGGELRQAGAPPFEYQRALLAHQLHLSVMRARRAAQGEPYWDAGEERYSRSVGPEVWAMRQAEGTAEQRRQALLATAVAAWERFEDAAAAARLRGLKAEAMLAEAAVARWAWVIVELEAGAESVERVGLEG